MINFTLTSEEAVAVSILDSLFSSTFNSTTTTTTTTTNSISNASVTDDELSTNDSIDVDEQQQLLKEAIDKMKTICPSSVSDRLEQKMTQILEDVCIGSITDVSMKKISIQSFSVRKKRRIFSSK